MLFLFWNVGAPTDVVHVTSGFWACFSLGSQHLVRAGGSSKKKQVTVLGNSTAGSWMLCGRLNLQPPSQRSHSAQLPFLSCPPCRAPQGFLGPCQAAWGPTLSPLHLSGSEVRVDSAPLSLEDLALQVLCPWGVDSQTFRLINRPSESCIAQSLLNRSPSDGRYLPQKEGERLCRGAVSSVILAGAFYSGIFVQHQMIASSKHDISVIITITVLQLGN